MANPQSYSFTNHMKNVYGKDASNAEYKRFSEEYFSGQDVRIYFGNMWVDEITGLQFSLQQNSAPIFGYASYTYDRMAVGSRQIQGTFRINFKESYYLHSIMNRLDLELDTVESNMAKAPSKEVYGSYGNFKPEHLSSAASHDEFESIALEFEKSLWGSASDSTIKETTENRRNESFFAGHQSKRALSDQGFNIVALYGPYTQSYDPSVPTESVATTAHTLTGVYLTGVNQIVDGSGQPIYEEYSFMARDLDGPVNNYASNPKYQFGQVVK